MKKGILRLRKNTFFNPNSKQIRLISLLTKGSLGLFMTSLLLVSCFQKKGDLALLFEEQEGQIAVSTEDYAITFVEDEVAIKLPSGQTVATINLESSTPVLVNNKVVYEDITQQADLIFYDKQNGNAGYDIRLQARGNLNDIQLQLSDSEDAYITGDGQLAIPIEEGEIRHSKPYAYQEIDGEKIEVESHFVLAEGILSFEVGEYNKNYKLVIDPTISLMMNATASKTAPNTADVGTNYVYTVGFSCPSTNDSSPCTGVFLSDPLPDGIDFITGASGVSYNANTRTVTYDFGSVANGSTVSVQFTVASPDFTLDGTVIENVASITYSQGPINETINTPTNSVTMTNGVILVDQIGVDKRNAEIRLSGNFDTGRSRQQITYGNRSSNPISNFVVEDILPAGLILGGNLGISALELCTPAVPYTVEIHTSDNMWRPLMTDYFGGTGAFSSDILYETPPNSISFDELSTYFGISGTTYPDGIRLTYATFPDGSCAHPDFDESNGALGISSYLDAARTGQTLPNAGDSDQNCADVSTTTVGFADQTECGNIDYVDASQSLRAEKSITTANSPYEPFEILSFDLSAGTVPDVTIAEVVDPYLIDIIPPGFTFQGIVSAAWDRPANVMMNMGSTSIDPVFTTITDYKGEIGQTALIWEWNAANMNSVTLPIPTNGMTRTNYQVTYEVAVDGTTTAGEYTNGFFFTADLPPSACSGAMVQLITDVDDVDNDGDITETFCRNIERVEIVIPNGLAGLDSRKEVNGNLDATNDFSRFPDFGMVSPSGEIIYRFSLSNPLSTTVENIVMVDVLPHVGDVGVVARSETRDSEWQPVFTANTLSDLQNYVNGISGATLYFSTECLPCLNADLGAPVTDPGGCNNPNWSPTAPSPISDVCAFKIEYGNSYSIATGQSTTFDIRMEAPANVPTNGEIAWNSFGFTGDAGGAPLLASEPIKVGIASFTEPCTLTINSSTPDASCSGGTYDVDFALTWTDAPTTGNFEVSIDGGNTFNTVVRTDIGANSSETISLTGVTCDGAMKNVEIRFADETTCSATSSYTAPAADCVLTINSSTPDASCSGGTYDVDFALTWTDAPTTGDFEVSIDGGTTFNTVTRTDLGASSSETITLTGVSCDGAMKNVEIRFADETTCSAMSSYTAPTIPCELTVTDFSISACTANQFDATFMVDWTNAPTTGGYEYTIDNGMTYIPITRDAMDLVADASGVTIVATGLTCEQVQKIQLRFVDEPTCFTEVMFIFPPADPAGYIYCTETGDIITGGTISVTPPMGGQVDILSDGSTGRYEWVAIGSPAVAGIYTMSYNPPMGFATTGTSGGFGDGNMILDPTAGMGDNLSGDDPLLIGTDANMTETMLPDFSSANNPFFLQFDLAPGDPFVDQNNIPLTGCAASCTLPTSVSAYAIQASCTDDMPNDDAYLQISEIVGGDRYGFSSGSSYMGPDYASATDTTGATYPIILQSGIANPMTNDTFTVRVYNESNTCFIDTLVVLRPQDCQLGCDCTDYIYLNDAGDNIIHKFPIAADGGVTTEIGNPWVDGNVNLQSPHGIAADLNGFLYISQLNGGAGSDQSFIMKLTCDGEIIDADDSDPDIDPFLDNQGDHNFFSVGNYLYSHPNFDGDATNTGSPSTVRIYNLCTGQEEGTQTTSAPALWGLTNGNDGYWYATLSPSGFSNSSIGVIRGPVDPTTFDGRASETVFTLADVGIPINTTNANNGPEGVTGITVDDEGMIYILVGGSNGFGPPSTIYKVDPTPPLSNASVVAQSLTDTQDYENGNGDTDINDGLNWGSTVGLTFSARSGYIYASSQDDCVAVFDKNLNYQLNLSNHTPASGFAKAIGLLTECCPTNNNQTVDLVQCVSPNSDSLFLNEIFPCDGGVICEAEWMPMGSAAAAIFEACDQSINTNAAAGCYTFTRSSDGTGANNQCGAFVQTLNLEIIEVEDISIAIDAINAPTCGTALTATTTAANIKWQSSTTGPDANDFMDIPGETASTLTTGTLTQTTYFRAVVVSANSAGSGSCPGGNCESPSNVISLDPVNCGTCTISIDNLTTSCLDNGTNHTVAFDVTWDYTTATSETIIVELNGIAVTGSGFTPSGTTGSQSFNLTLQAPGFGNILRAYFSTTTSCEATSTPFDLVPDATCSPVCTDGLGGTVFNDLDNDGVEDGGEAGLGNILVEIYECDNDIPVKSVYTNSDGNWTADASCFTFPVRVEFSTSITPDVDPSIAGTNNGTDVQFVSMARCDVDFGILDNSTIQVGNYVWNDNDQDGVQDACEDPISDLIVKLYDDAGLLIGQDTTDVSGEYYFDITNVDTLGITVDGVGSATPNTGFVGFNEGEKYFIVFMGDSYDDTNNEITVGGTMYSLTTVDDGEGTNLDQNDSDVSEMNVPTVGNMPVIMFVADSTDHTFDAGLIEQIPILGAIGNYVWLDENSDGLQDAGEPGIPNVKVVLKDVSGNPIDSTLTAPDGSYLFPDLASAMYFVDIDETTLPDTDGNAMTQDLTQTTIFTNVVDGSDADTDNDDGDFGNKDHSANGDFGYKITLDSGEENLTADFGYNYNPTDDVNNPMGSPLGALGDRVWYDADRDGMQDPEEAGVEGVTLKLIAASEVTVGGMMFSTGDQIATDVTDETGFYLFDGLPAGAYNVMIADDANGTGVGGPLDGFMQTGDPDHFATSEADNPDDTVEDDNMTTKPVILGPGDVFLNVDFGYDNDAVLGSIGDYVWLDADADGNGPNANGATGTPVNQGNGSADDAAETPIEGVTVVLIKDTNGDGKWDEGESIIASDKTDADGLYYFPGLPTGADADYLVLVTDTDNVLDGLKPTYDGDNNGETMPTDNYPRSQMANMELGLSSVTDLGTTPVLNQDFGYTPEEQDAGEGLIGDYVWYDTNSDGVQDAEESGIEGVKVDLYDLGDDEAVGGTGANEDTYLGSTVTDENGYYYFGGLSVDLDGEGYQVRIAAAGSPSGMDNFASGMALEDLVNTSDPDNTMPNPDSEGGAVSLDETNPISLDQDFGYVADPNNDGSIGNKVWFDINANGVRDAGEMGFNSVTIDLYRDLNGNGELDPGEPKIGSTVTATAMGDDGMYLFENLPIDSFIVDVTDVDGVLSGYWHTDGSQDPTSGVAGDTADDASGGTSGDNSKTDAFSVGLTAGVPNNLNVDFGYYKDPAAVGNYVWLDANSDGTQDDAEMGINNVVVTMMIEYPDATMVTLETTTATKNGKMGFYEFPNLLFDEDYRIGSGSAEADPVGVSTSSATPKYTIKVLTAGQDGMGQALDGLVPTVADANGPGLQPSDAEDLNGVNTVPIQGSQNTAPQTDETTEQDEAKYDFAFTTNLVGIGGTVWNDTGAASNENNGAQDNDESGIAGVKVYLLRDVDQDNMITGAEETPIDSMLTNIDGTYLFEGLQPGKYQIRIPASNFGIGQPLESLPFSSVPTNSTNDNDTDNDDNGIQTVGSGEIITPIYMLIVGTEPMAANESLTPSQDGGNNSARDGSTNTTIDLGLQDIELPVELLSFQAKADKDHIDLVWSTASELNNSHFELERSENGKVFKQIARVEGQGTTLEQADYSYDDHEVIPGILYYYRLKQVDFDGVFEYSEVRTAELEPLVGGMELYPNPIGDATELQVRFYTTELTKEFVIMDMHSRSVLQVKEDLKSMGWNTMSIDIRVLPAGTYLILDKEGNSMQFIKTRE